MIELSIPAVLGMVVVGLYNMMDSIFVGQMVGDVQMGAISVSYHGQLGCDGSSVVRHLHCCGYGFHPPASVPDRSQR